MALNDNYKPDTNNIAPAGAGPAIDVAAADQTPAGGCIGVYVATAGDLVCRLAGEDADSTFANLVAGVDYYRKIKIVRKVGTTITGRLLYG